MRFEIALSRPAYVKIIWVGADGQADEIYPNRTQSPTQPIQAVQSPSQADSGWPLSGSPGMETAWILIDMDREIQLTASDFDVKPRAFNEESYYRTIVTEMRSGDRILLNPMDRRLVPWVRSLRNLTTSFVINWRELWMMSMRFRCLIYLSRANRTEAPFRFKIMKRATRI